MEESTSFLKAAETTPVLDNISSPQVNINSNMKALATKHHVVATLCIWASCLGLAVSFQDVSVVLELSGKFPLIAAIRFLFFHNLCVVNVCPTIVYYDAGYTYISL
jgi:hypothetical protein